jgi:predicted lipoprotein
MILKRYFIHLTVAILPAIGFSCQKPATGSDFDRKTLLSFCANAHIKPGYSDLTTSLQELKISVENIKNQTDTSVITIARNKWVETYTKWMHVNAFNFGPAGEQGLTMPLVQEIGTFPVSESKIETAISNNNWNLNDFNRDARGLLTVEYLLFRPFRADSTLISLSDTIRLNYLTDVVTNTLTRVQAVSDAWNGSYYNTFISNDGTDAGSSISIFYNEFVKSYETIKNYKLELPLGLRPGQTQPDPTLAEARYSGTSMQMMREHFAALVLLWKGISVNGTTGVGFIDYLETVPGGDALITSTQLQITATENALASVPDSPSFSVLVQNNDSRLLALHTEIQKMTRYFKSDLSSLIGIAITYSSSDGD